MAEDIGYISDLRNWMRRIVLLQDKGVPVGEHVTNLIGISASHSLMCAIDTERLRMIHEGLDVIREKGDARVAALIRRESK